MTLPRPFTIHYYTMKSGILITGTQSPLKQSLATVLLHQKKRIIMTVEQEEPPFLDVSPEELILLDYKRRSLLSAQSLFLECKNKGIAIKHLIITQSILDQSDVLQGFQGSVIEQKIDADMKGLMFLLKESIAYFEKQGTGSINIVLHNNGPEIPGPLEALLKGGIEALCASLFAYYGMESYSLRGYSARGQSSTEYAHYILKSIEGEQTSGKWYHFRNRGNRFKLSRN